MGYSSLENKNTEENMDRGDLVNEVLEKKKNSTRKGNVTISATFW